MKPSLVRPNQLFDHIWEPNPWPQHFPNPENGSGHISGASHLLWMGVVVKRLQLRARPKLKSVMLNLPDRHHKFRKTEWAMQEQALERQGLNTEAFVSWWLLSIVQFS